MATTTDQPIEYVEQPLNKGLKGGALGLLSSVVIGVASTAPAYSLAATLGLIVAVVGVHSASVAVLSFIPMLLCSIAYSEFNKADPDCGTTFTWATRAFGPKTGWAGGWGIIAADVLVMASLAQVAGQYVFLLFGANGIGGNPTSPWVFLVGIMWIIVMAYICYRGIEVSANFQKALLSIEVVMLTVLAVVALVKVGTGHAPQGHLTPSASWFSPLGSGGFSPLVGGLVLMLFIYWGWDTTVAVNEETKDTRRTPGRAAVISTVLLLLIYALVIFSLTAFAGVGKKGVGLANPANVFDVLSVQGHAAFGGGGVGTFFTRLLILMVLSSAAASTQTTILPQARTTLSMAAYKALPSTFAKIQPRYLTPSVSTIAMGVISIGLYTLFNFIGTGNTIILDGYSAIGVYIAFYYGLTGFACAWYYRKTLTRNARDLWMQGILPVLGGLLMYALGGYAVWETYDVATLYSYTHWTMPFSPHWQIGGAFLISFIAALAGLLIFLYMRATAPAFFRKETLTRATPTLLPDE